jgi:hypothetical protein
MILQKYVIKLGVKEKLKQTKGFLVIYNLFFEILGDLFSLQTKKHFIYFSKTQKFKVKELGCASVDHFQC